MINAVMHPIDTGNAIWGAVERRIDAVSAANAAGDTFTTARLGAGIGTEIGLFAAPFVGPTVRLAGRVGEVGLQWPIVFDLTEASSTASMTFGLDRIMFRSVLATDDALAAAANAPRQTMGFGLGWYENMVAMYGARNVEWVSGSGRTIEWVDPWLPVPAQTSGFRVAVTERSSTFVAELEMAAGPRPAGAIAHHDWPLMLGGLDNGFLNGSWVLEPQHIFGHSLLTPQVQRLPYGTFVIIKPK
jgi:hypothetical protein